jgi:thiol-disulfide isomerase/thioredoxin/surface antigen
VKLRVALCVVVLVACAAVAAAALVHRDGGRWDPQASEADVASQLRESFFSYDYEAGVALGRKAFSGEGGTPEVGAWYALNAARGSNEAEALRVAEELLARDRGSAWAQFALAAALIWNDKRAEEALAASKRALEASPNRVDFLWLRAETLRLRNRKDEAIELLDAHRSVLDRSVELLVVKASAIYDKSLPRGLDARTRDQLQSGALTIFHRARRLDATSVGPAYTAAWFLTVSRRIPEAYALLRPIAEESASPRVHGLYWSALRDNWELDARQKTELAALDIDRFVARRPGHASTLSLVVNAADGLGLEAKLRAIEARLLEEYRDSKEAEELLLNRAARAGLRAPGQSRSLAAESARHRQMLKSFIARPTHHDPTAVERAHTMLFESAENDRAVGDDELLEIIQGMRRRVASRPEIVFARSATALAKRGAHLDVAEKLARDGVSAIPSAVDGAREKLADEQSVRSYEGYLHATMRDALGQVLLQQNRLREAEQQLLVALEHSPSFAAANLHLGHVYERKGRLATAEDYYLRSYSGGGTTQVHDESAAALENLYEKRRGSKAGLAEYRVKLDRKVRSLERASLSAQVRGDAKRPEDFLLDRLEGGKLRLSSLKGKYAVIAFWGKWCDACRSAMPELAKAFSRYGGTSDVAFLTINNDPNPEEVRRFMASNGYDFDVVLDDGYAARSGVTSVPQVWFLDKQGRKVFEIKGHSTTVSLPDEIGTRLALLRDR